MKKVTIECSEEELNIIEKALELYSRIGLCQFESLSMVTSLEKEINKDKTYQLKDAYQQKCKDLKSLFGLKSNAYWGIFNKENVHDDVRISAHIHQTLRHEKYKNRISTGEQNEKHFTVDEYPADICQIANMNLPNFKIIISDKNENTQQ